MLENIIPIICFLFNFNLIFISPIFLKFLKKIKKKMQGRGFGPPDGLTDRISYDTIISAVNSLLKSCAFDQALLPLHLEKKN